MNVQDAQSALNGVAKDFIIVPMLDELIFFAIGWYRAPAPPSAPRLNIVAVPVKSSVESPLFAVHLTLDAPAETADKSAAAFGVSGAEAL